MVSLHPACVTITISYTRRYSFVVLCTGTASTSTSTTSTSTTSTSTNSTSTCTTSTSISATSTSTASTSTSTASTSTSSEDLENISIAVGIFFLGTTELEIHLGLGVILPPSWTSEGVKNHGHLGVRLLDTAVQARLLELNPRGFFTPCVCHNYNLLYSEI